jgi:drug/metabolite transporter (DMT)-like permease
MFSAIEPAVAVVLAAIVLAEPISPLQVVGIAILVGALGALGLGVRQDSRTTAQG